MPEAVKKVTQLEIYRFADESFRPDECKTLVASDHLTHMLPWQSRNSPGYDSGWRN